MASADLSMVAQAINSGFVPVLHGDAVLDDLQGCTILSGDVIIRHLAAYLKPEYVVFLVSFFHDIISYYCISWTELCGSLSNHLLFLSAQPESDSSKMTDVLGVYDRPPSEPNAVLLREIAVSEDGSWSVVKPTLEDMKKQESSQSDIPKGDYKSFAVRSTYVFYSLPAVETTVAAHDTTGGMATKISEAALIAKLGIDVYIVKVVSLLSYKVVIPPVSAESVLDDEQLGTRKMAGILSRCIRASKDLTT
ncbi:hypothetical protein NC652_026070 [Populus alba x Populus x berolinensis]|nr:hypothetical protein NC652_026070 [Populus alba x Populus x berolinensis]